MEQSGSAINAGDCEIMRRTVRRGPSPLAAHCMQRPFSCRRPNLIAILSDIHGNLEALEAVLRDINSRGIKDIVCIGDVVGYGVNPRECIKHAANFKLAVRGNHEDALLFIAMDFNPEAAVSVEWTRNALNDKNCDKSENHALWNFIGGLKEKFEEGEYIYLHGSPRIPTREYVRPSDIRDDDKMTEIFALIKHVCFCGHTHEPGVITDERRFISPQIVGSKYQIDQRKCIINVGSVGQPRDKDNRACYVTFDGKTVEFKRVSYNFEATMAKILAVKELPRQLATRLKSGR
jgi:predicted phosphodiesterase